MSLTVSQGEGTMVITITSSPKSTCPILCQILSSLCYGPVCFVSEDVKEKLTDTQRVLGIVQIIFGVMNILLGIFGLIFFVMLSASMITVGGLQISVIALSFFQLFVAFSFFIMTGKSLCRIGGSKKLEESTASHRSGIFPRSFPFVQSCNMMLSQDVKVTLTDNHTTLGTVQIIVGVMNITLGCFGFVFSFWIGGVFLIVAFMCVLAVKFPSPKLLLFLVILNAVSAALAITTVGLYSMELAMGNNNHFNCNRGYYPYYSSNNEFETCLYYSDLNQVILRGLGVMMIVLSVLQFFVSITFCVLTGKALCKKTIEDEDEEMVKDPELYKPLLEDDTE